MAGRSPPDGGDQCGDVRKKQKKTENPKERKKGAGGHRADQMKLATPAQASSSDRRHGSQNTNDAPAWWKTGRETRWDGNRLVATASPRRSKQPTRRPSPNPTNGAPQCAMPHHNLDLSSPTPSPGAAVAVAVAVALAGWACVVIA